MRRTEPNLSPVVAIALAVACSGCSPVAWGIAGGGAAAICAYAPSRWNHAYQTRYEEPVIRQVAQDTSHVEMGFVEYDDFGWMRDTTQARVLLDEIQALHRRTNVAVVVYVHGWRHNAKENDADVKSFRATLRHLGHSLNDSLMKAQREALTGDPDLTVFGIYVGWRGKAWPEVGRWVPYVGPAVLDLPVYFTSFGRKDAAGIVGGGDVRSFLLHLDDMHREINAVARVTPRVVKPLGLVFVGHSYGGHVIFSALNSRIEDGMAAALADSATLKGQPLADRVYATARSGELLACDRPVQGVGDLVVLVNPAIEASAYRRIDHMDREAKFRDDQLPLLLTVSAENDAARNGIFAFMRGIKLFGRAKSTEEAKLERRALGSYEPQVTHQMELTRTDAEAKKRARVHVIEEGRDQLSARRGESALGRAGNGPAARPDDIFAKNEHGVIRMRANPGMELPRPALVVRTKSDVIDGHSDFFRAEFIDWLTEYVLSIERVRLANAAREAQAAGVPAELRR